MKAMIFAAGLGTRLKPYTLTMPKALVPVCGTSLLEHLLKRLKRAGFTEVVINVHHFAEQIYDFVAHYDDSDLTITLSDERSGLLETGGGIKHAQNLLGSDAPFFVHNVDILSNLDFQWFVSQHRLTDVVTLLVSDRKTERYLLFDESMRLVGWTNVKSGEVKSPYTDLDVAHCRKYAFSGIHVVSPAVFGFMSGWGERFSIIDFYLSVCRDVCITGVVDSHLEMIDVGKIDSLHEAESFVKHHDGLYL